MLIGSPGSFPRGRERQVGLMRGIALFVFGTASKFYNKQVIH